MCPVACVHPCPNIKTTITTTKTVTREVEKGDLFTVATLGGDPKSVRFKFSSGVGYTGGAVLAGAVLSRIQRDSKARLRMVI